MAPSGFIISKPETGGWINKTVHPPHPKDQMPKSSKILITLLSVLVAACITLWIMAGQVLVQLFIAIALAYILNPLVARLEKYKFNRTLSVLLVFSLALIVVISAIIVLAVSVKSEFVAFQPNIPEYARRMYAAVPDEVKTRLHIETPDLLSSRIESVVRGITSTSFDAAKPLLTWINRALSSTVGFILNLLGYFIIPIYLFYLLTDMPLLTGWLKELPPLRFRETLAMLAKEIDSVLSGFIRGQLLVCSILAILYSAGLWMIGIDLAVVIGTLAGATFIIPYVGTIIGIVLSMTMAVLKFHDLLHPLLCLGWFCLIQAIEGTIITPKVVGDTVGLHPLIAIVALLIGGQVLGIAGMLIAIPSAAVLKVFARHILQYYRSSEFYQGT